MALRDPLRAIRDILIIHAYAFIAMAMLWVRRASIMLGEINVTFFSIVLCVGSFLFMLLDSGIE
jgi:hypothetical protein